MKQILLAFSLAVFAAGPGRGQNQGPGDAAALAYGETHSSCLEWSDGCVVCVHTAGLPACSTPGVACQPHATTCKTATPAKPE